MFFFEQFARAPSCQSISFGSISDASVLFVVISGPSVVLFSSHLLLSFAIKTTYRICIELVSNACPRGVLISDEILKNIPNTSQVHDNFIVSEYKNVHLFEPQL